MNFRAPLLVGFVLVASAVSLTWFVMSTSKDKFNDSSTYPLNADFSDASGIRSKTRVQINGIDVGKIASITHVQRDDGRLTARIRLRIHKNFSVYSNAHLRKAAVSLLGDFRIDLDPGSPQNTCGYGERCPNGFSCEQNICVKRCSRSLLCPSGMACRGGICANTKLEPEGLIKSVQSVSDLDEIQAQLKNVARNVADVTESLSHVLSGPQGEGSMREIMERVERSMGSVELATEVLAKSLQRNDARIDAIVRNVNDLTGALASAAGTGGSLSESLASIARLTENVDKMTASLNSMVESDSDESASIRRTIESLNVSMDNLASITGKVDGGEGTIAKLINDPGIAEKAEATLESTAELLGSVSRLQTEVELRTQYEVPWSGGNDEIQAAIKNTLAINIKPKPDKYYIIEAISDPRGKQARELITTTDGNDVTTKTETSTIKFDALKFSAMFAKRYYFLTMRFGIIENTGGVGINLHSLDDRLEFRLDVFDFARRDPDRNRAIFPRLRSLLMYEFINHLSVQAGIDDPLNAKLRTWFFGGVLRFTDEDLKTILMTGVVPGA